eukprot:CAMPEP_0114512886 /NCGR_PEP_ID=MMETSP0109-20121206/15242_1 /TAXON_ID=29199 /ORGANISM="Chlorarachnion reptans, Strain CCCM449" /LENGTH=136 /DNA_ID=CAMNT_0001692655 /DNA_START=207 /DNA_END=620 /DNA_ORIENTATION=+
MGTGERKEDGKKKKKKKVADILEEYLSGKEFPLNLSESLSKAAMGQSASIVNDEILMKTIGELWIRLPQTLKKELPDPDKEFVEGSLAKMKSKRPRSGCWNVNDVPEMLQTVLITLAITVDRFRDMGGFEVDATSL